MSKVPQPLSTWVKTCNLKKERKKLQGSHRRELKIDTWILTLTQLKFMKRYIHIYDNNSSSFHISLRENNWTQESFPLMEGFFLLDI